MNVIKINDFYIGKKIGKGTFGEVSVCFDQTNAERRVIKKIRKEIRFIEYAKKEIKILNILKENTTNIIELIDNFMHEEIQYLVFEYMETNLYQYYKNSIIKYNDVIHIMYEVIKGLDFIHQKKIIHCDLKPENIMLNTSGSKIVKIIDFGSSKFNEERKNHFYIASRYYRAPELAFEIYFNNSIDIWSYGCIFFEILFRKPLVPARSKHDLIYLLTTLIGIPDNGRYFTSKLYRKYFIWNEEKSCYIRDNLIDNCNPTNPFGLSQRIDRNIQDREINRKELHKLLCGIIQYDYVSRLNTKQILESEIFKN